MRRSRRETKITAVEITFSNGLHIRMLPDLQQAVCWQDFNGDITNFERVTLDQLIEDLKERKRSEE